MEKWWNLAAFHVRNTTHHTHPSQIKPNCVLYHSTVSYLWTKMSISPSANLFRGDKRLSEMERSVEVRFRNSP